MKWLAFTGVVAVLLAGCGDEAATGKTSGSESILQQSSGGAFRARLARETGETEEPGTSADKIGRSLALARIDTNVVTKKPESPTPESKFIRAKVEEVAADYSWVTATVTAEEGVVPSVGDWAAVIERSIPDNINPNLERKRDMVMGLGRVMELQGDIVKIQLDKASVQPRIKKGNDVVIRWY